MTPDEMRDKAVDLFKKRFHCSQAVLAVGQEKMNIVNEEVIKAMGLFGGGICGTCRACGALTGGIALISSLFSRGNLEEKENPRMWSLGTNLSEHSRTTTANTAGRLQIAQDELAGRDQVRFLQKSGKPEKHLHPTRRRHRVRPGEIA